MAITSFFFLSRQTSALSKTPGHLAFLFLEPSAPAVDDVAHLVFMAVCAGASHVSLYDYHGRLKACQVDLLRALQRAQRAYLVQARPHRSLLKRIHWHSHDQGSGNGNGR